jgi:anti-anti-sigma regulatory factor
MNPIADEGRHQKASIDLRLYRNTAATRVRVTGNLLAANAHLLFKVVVGHLRRHAVPALELDLADIVEVDHVGVGVIEDCRRYAQRHGVLLTLVGVPAAIQGVLDRQGAGDLLPAASRVRSRGHLPARPRPGDRTPSTARFPAR